MNAAPSAFGTSPKYDDESFMDDAKFNSSYLGDAYPSECEW